MCESIMSIIKMHNWSSDIHGTCVTRIYFALINYLGTQLQDKLPYSVPYVNSNDEIFIGNEDFGKEACELMDDIFSEVLETITKLNGMKASHLKELFFMAVTAANTLIVNCDVMNKSISSYTNKLFKMSDGYLTEFNNTIGEDPANAHMRLNRNIINKTFDAFRKKKEACKAEHNIRASTTTSAHY